MRWTSAAGLQVFCQCPRLLPDPALAQADAWTHRRIDRDSLKHDVPFTSFTSMGNLFCVHDRFTGGYVCGSAVEERLASSDIGVDVSREDLMVAPRDVRL
ncbi:unnamed protein product [Effrenium voratum]|uniref:Uncharacterized protein n=1 Tax=Effrenium voratum TaxID=2562239 RepID=A0AA36J164_9DINO|nr:unnamed protein product [Effrenium voratum]